MSNKRQYSFKDYVNKLLAGAATAIIVGLVANAILGGIFGYLSSYAPIFGTLRTIVATMQFLIPVFVGVLSAMQFNLKPMESILVGAASFLGSGAYIITEEGVKLVGIGDLVNVILISGLAIFVVRSLQGKLGSLTMILLPIIVSIGVGTIGLLALPYVSLITSTIGNVINHFTQLQPLLMAILISAAFSVIIVSPISAAAIGIAIGITGLGAGSASAGITATIAVLVIGSRKVNEVGTTLAIPFGAMKMMMPNLIRYPRIVIPLIINGVFSGVGAYLFDIQGIPSTSGFGIVGLVAPIQSYNMGANIVSLLLAYFVIPFVGAFIVDYILNNVLNIYNDEIFKFIPAE